MTTFKKENFNYDGMYLTYLNEEMRYDFIARFKYRGMVTMGIFKKALMLSGISPMEYQRKLANRETPTGILEENGILRLDFETASTYVNGTIVRTLLPR